MITLCRLFLITLALTLYSNANAQSWKVYDNFDSGFINSSKWDVYNMDSNGNVKGTVTVVNKKMRIVHYPLTATSGSSFYIELKQFKNTIQGIQADIKVHSCTGKQEARLETIFGYTSRIGTDYNVVTAQTSVRPHQNVIAGVSFIDRYKSNGDYVSYTKDDSWNGLYDFPPITNKTKRVYVRVNKGNKKTMYWYVAGANQSVRHLPKAVKALPSSLQDHYISSRRREDIGDSMQNCIIDIDNVKVYR